MKNVTFFFHETVAQFRLSKGEYQANEAMDAMMPVKISTLQTVALANPVTFRVTPLDIDTGLSLSLNLPDSALEEVNPDTPFRASKTNIYRR